jgi:hypothetical protein
MFLAMRNFQEESSFTISRSCRTKKGCGSRSSELLPALALGTNSSVLVFKNEIIIYEKINFTVFRAKKREKK